MRIPRIACVVAFFAIPGAASAADALCGKLETFAREQEAEVADPMPRHWVEFHWGVDTDPNTFWSWGCRHSSDQSSQQLCAWLMENTSREFRDYLPLRVQKCFGYRFPKQAWSGWHVSEGMIEHQRRNGSWLVLEIASKGLQQGEGAVRISYNTVDRRLDPDELEPIQPLRQGEGLRAQ